MKAARKNYSDSKKAALKPAEKFKSSDACNLLLHLFKNFQSTIVAERKSTFLDRKSI